MKNAILRPKNGQVLVAKRQWRVNVISTLVALILVTAYVSAIAITGGPGSRAFVVVLGFVDICGIAALTRAWKSYKIVLNDDELVYRTFPRVTRIAKNEIVRCYLLDEDGISRLIVWPLIQLRSGKSVAFKVFSAYGNERAKSSSKSMYANLVLVRASINSWRGYEAADG